MRLATIIAAYTLLPMATEDSPDTEHREPEALDQDASEKSYREHDKVYRQIFDRASIIEEILLHFATGPWAKKLDFSTLESMPKNFMNLRLERRESDILWRVRHGRGEDDWFYVFILMELQSKVERMMALRLWGYSLHLAELLVRRKKYLPSASPRLLPPILPVVLYNGEAPWTAPLSLAKLFQPMEGYDPPDFRYVVLDVNRYAPEELRPVRTVTSGVFLMEQASDLAALERVIGEIEYLIEDPALEKDVALLVRDVALKLDLRHEEIPETVDLQEVKMSLLQRAEKWTQEWFAQGKAEGRAEGLRLGKVETLKLQARQRFGELPSWAVDLVERADVDTLDRWLGQLLTADHLEGVFE